jgi:hypothetical protein
MLVSYMYLTMHVHWKSKGLGGPPHTSHISQGEDVVHFKKFKAAEWQVKR